MLDAPQAMLDERRRPGHDVRDEMWDGVLHMVPPPDLLYCCPDHLSDRGADRRHEGSATV
jgi:hypothetical protein